MADLNKAHAAITVSFGQTDEEVDASKGITLELNDVLNDGKTSFDFGEKVHIRCFTQPGAMALNNAEATYGTPGGPTGEDTLAVEDEVISFIDTDTANTAKPVDSGFSYSWMGNAMGIVTVQADGTLKAAQSGTGVLKVSYTTRFRKITLVAPQPSGEDSYQVIVSIKEA